MPTIFTRIINGELPGRFVWRDEQSVAFLTINPIKPGHTLVVPRAEVDHWLDLPIPLAHHLTTVSRIVGRAIQEAFNPVKVGWIIAGLEVPHVHIHLIPIHQLQDLNFANANPNPKPEDLEHAAEAIRSRLRAAGHGENCAP